MSLLLVEDDSELAAALTEALRSEGLAINHVSRGADALHVARTEPPDVMILDLGLPDMDGLDVLRELRTFEPELPVLLLTARNTVSDKVTGLDHGADDYLAKPFEMAELLARLRALRRRVNPGASGTITIGRVQLNTADHATLLDGEPVDLGRREFMLLRALMENPGRVLTRDQLERKLYSWGEEVSSNALEVHVHHLRKKLDPGFIETVRGVGYRVCSS